MSSPVDRYYERARLRPEAHRRLREILLDCGLDEELKWGKPCYAHAGENLAIVQSMKGFLALMFFRGILLEAPEGVLEEQGESSHAARRICFPDEARVDALEPVIRDLVQQAIDRRHDPLPEPPERPLPPELAQRLDDDPAFAAAFHGLTPGRQRAYALDIGGAKQSATRLRRLDKHAPRILAGKGLRDP